MNKLTPPEMRRYKRHIRLQGFGPDGQEKLKAAAVLVVGIGALGSPVLQYLSSSGVGHIGIVDPETISESDLHGQQLFTSFDVGKHKSIMAKQYLERQNPFLACEIFNIKLTQERAAGIISPYDLVVDTTDNPEAKYVINDACIALGKPMVYGCAHQYKGELSVFNYRQGPSYRCLYPQRPEKRSKEQAGVLGAISGIIGTMQVSEALKIIAGAGEILSGKLYRFNAWDFSSQFVPITRNADNFS